MILNCLGLFRVRLRKPPKHQTFKNKPMKKGKQNAVYEYFSKWRKKWVLFTTQPTEKEFSELKLYKYEVRKVGMK
jgi:hypothetical protein